jgi:plastocyanin
VRAGQAVRWAATDDVFHTVTSTAQPRPPDPDGRFDRTLSRTGQTFTYTFQRPGTYHYYCRPHSDFMTGTVRVVS